MNRIKKLKYTPLIILVMILAMSQFKYREIDINIKDIIQANLGQCLKVVKITEEKIKINDKKISINLKMPQIHFTNSNVERYINSYIRRNINEYINYKRQEVQLNNSKKNTDVSITYDIAFENKDLLNIVVYKEVKTNNDKLYLEKDSYIFDLNTGQRIYLNNFLKDNSDYKEVIKEYIYKYIDKNKLDIDKSKIKINKDTNYIITDRAITVYFNPYKSSDTKANYEFKIPHEVFKNKIKVIDTHNIVANIDTQTITKNNKYINSIINIPIIITSNKEIEKYINHEIRNDIMEFYNNAQNEAKNYLGNLVNLDEKFVANANFDVKKNSDNILSIGVNFYTYSGGAHGYDEDVFYNLDMNSGKLLKLSDLFKENSSYEKIINEEIRKQIASMIKLDKEYEEIYQFKGIKHDNKFFIQDDNLVIHFDLYEIAPYAAGQPIFNINISLINHIIKEEYVDIFQ